MSPLSIDPVDYFNLHVPFADIFNGDKTVHMKSATEACYLNPADLSDDINKPTFTCDQYERVSVLKENPFSLAKGSIISKFMLLSAVKFKNDWRSAESYVMYKLMDAEIPYIRVGTVYYKITTKDNRWGGKETTLTTWNKDTISDDHSKSILKLVPKFDSFIVAPDNKNHSRIHDNCYNHYAQFAHTPHPDPVSTSDIPNSLTVMRHIFGDQFAVGMKYMKILYEHPRQMQQVLVLVSKERETGKTTFIDWLFMIFGDNAVNITPEALTSEFNAAYATKNILVMEEAMMEKAAGVEKLKSITTAKMITVRQLYTPAYSIPFFGKVVICTNKVKDFMRIDDEENRFWIRYINPVKGKRNTKIDEDLYREIPAFLRYLSQMPPIDFSKGRFALTSEETRTVDLDNVKHESKSGLRKDLEILIDQFFSENDLDEFYATAIDLKKEWFPNDHKVSHSYLVKVLRDEMKLTTHPNYPGKIHHYLPFGKKSHNGYGQDSTGKPFRFLRTVEKIENFKKVNDQETLL